MLETSKSFLGRGMVFLGAFTAFSSLCQAAPPVASPPLLPQREILIKQGIRPEALATLLKRGAETHSDAVVVIKDGVLIGEWYFGKPQKTIEAMSATKSIASLAIGCLISEGKIKSLDEPVYKFYPEWNQGRKKRITIRHLMNHTSGLQANASTEEIYASPNFVQLALAAELTSAPGDAFFYNNKAVNLLGGIVQKVSGQSLDMYVNEHLFAPLGIVDYRWDEDKAGNTQVFAGLQLHAMDLAKIGQMLADGGMWKGSRIVEKSWISEMATHPGQSLTPSCGLLWWLLHKWAKGTIDDSLLQSWRKAGVPSIYVSKAKMIKGQTFERPKLFALLEKVFGGQANMIKELRDRQLAPMRTVTGPVVGYFADGYLGQYLIVLPRQHLIVVRQISAESFKSDETDNFDDFMVRVPALVGETVAGD